jgi:hypothetical protein
MTAALTATDIHTEAANDFAARAAHDPRVVAVTAIPTSRGVAVWTLLDGDSDSRSRDAVYRLEMETLRRFPQAALGFRVLDVAEFPDRTMEMLLPAEARPLFVRLGADSRIPLPAGHAQ